ncbi:MAG: helix-turn-helix transcriptional regulator [Sphingomonas sp.]|uniref:helix-turn-helix domain-containing protein n=1 Tax=Sphingomonas sp. TaxID=28214 RepID=UPI001AD39C8A|nr:XRE family transcriptional regulator [Sphingomonas sp.]MBN8809355.1 helix-turn-helix transcriptional regulator [Sphingomonas sp.]
MEQPTITEAPWPLSGKPALPVGDRIRARRKALDMTLQDLADRSGLSAPFISQAERHRTVPSIVSLLALAKALGVDISYFMSVPHSDKIVSRADEPREIEVDSPVTYYDLTAEFESRRLDAMILHIPPGYAFRIDRHHGEHFRYVLKGEVYAKAGDVETVLREGDSMHFDSLLPHGVANRSSETAIMLHVGTPSMFKTNPIWATTGEENEGLV